MASSRPPPAPLAPTPRGGQRVPATRFPPRLHADRVAGGDRDHRHPDRPAAARRPEGPRGRRPHAVHEQPQADRPGAAQLPRRQPASFPNAGSDGPNKDCCNASTRVGWTWMYHLTPYIEQDNVYNEPDRRGRRPDRRSRSTTARRAASRRCTPTAAGATTPATAAGTWPARAARAMLVRQWNSPSTSKPVDAPVEQTRRIDRRRPTGCRTPSWSARSSATRPSSGSAGGDNEPWNNSGWDQDHVRFGEAVPQPDAMHPTSASPTFWSVRFGGSHPGGFNAVMGDGSVRFIRYGDRRRPTGCGICLINDGEVITDDFVTTRPDHPTTDPMPP